MVEGDRLAFVTSSPILKRELHIRSRALALLPEKKGDLLLRVYVEGKTYDEWLPRPAFRSARSSATCAKGRRNLIRRRSCAVSARSSPA